MIIHFTDEEIAYITDTFEIMDDCPDDIRESIEDKMKTLDDEYNQ